MRPLNGCGPQKLSATKISHSTGSEQLVGSIDFALGLATGHPQRHPRHSTQVRVHLGAGRADS